MKQIFKFVILILCFYEIHTQEEAANKIITLFIEQYPTKGKSHIDQAQARELCNIIQCKSLELPSNFGIFATYMGYLALSDENGQITFPRKTIKDSVNILVTPKTFPIFMFQNTIAYWQIPHNTPAHFYRIDRNQDEETGLYYWNVTQRQLGKKRQVPLHTIVIFTDPDDIYIPEGVSLINNNPQLLLPTIYSKKNKNYAKNSLFILTIKPFFSKINKLFKERPLGYALHITD